MALLLFISYIYFAVYRQYIDIEKWYLVNWEVGFWYGVEIAVECYADIMAWDLYINRIWVNRAMWRIMQIIVTWLCFVHLKVSFVYVLQMFSGYDVIVIHIFGSKAESGYNTW